MGKNFEREKEKERERTKRKDVALTDRLKLPAPFPNWAQNMVVLSEAAVFSRVNALFGSSSLLLGRVSAMMRAYKTNAAGISSCQATPDQKRREL